MEKIAAISRDELRRLLLAFGQNEWYEPDPVFIPGHTVRVPPPGEEDLHEFIRAVESNSFLRSRDRIEDDPCWVQPIAYVIVAHGNKIVQSTRTGGEERLLGRRSLGIGGHVNREDFGNRMSAIQCAAIREVKEETNVKALQAPVPVGLIVGGTAQVDLVHVGFVFVARIEDMIPLVTDTNLAGGLHSVADIETESKRLSPRDQTYERWSYALLEGLDYCLNLARDTSCKNEIKLV